MLIKLTFCMEKHKITEIAKKMNVTHGAVSQWFSGLTVPKYKYMVLLNEEPYNIPFEAWKDIKSYADESISSQQQQADSIKKG